MWPLVEERIKVINQPAGDPDAGDVIPGTGGVRKMRFAAGGQGKRGGFRVTYYASGGRCSRP